MDVFHKFVKFLDHERYKVAGVLIAVLITVSIVGCQPKTMSLLRPEEKVDAAGLNMEIATIQAKLDVDRARLDAEIAEYEASVDEYNAKIDAADADLQAQIELRQKVINVVGGIGTAVAEGTFAPSAVIGSLTSLALAGLAVGGVADGVRKNRIIKREKGSGEQ